VTDLHAWITQQVHTVERSIEEDCIPSDEAAPILRRCEADRRILARHTLDPRNPYAIACHGCGTYSDMDLANVDNLNDCPELLDLAHAQGVTAEILASLDQPTPPERKSSTGPRLAHWITPPITTSDVPEALLGRRWKP